MNLSPLSLPVGSLASAAASGHAHAPSRQPAIDLAALFDAVPTPYLIVSPRLTILTANAAYLRLIGRSRAEIAGRNVFNAFPDNPGDPQADGASKLQASLQRVLATGRTDSMPIQKYDVAVKAGGTQFVSRYWKVVNTPVFDAAHAVSYIVLSAEEITAAFVANGPGLRGVLANLTDRIRDLKTAEDIGYEAAAILGEALDASRVGYGTIDHASDTMTVARDWCADGVDTLAGQTVLRDYGSSIDELKLNNLTVVANAAEDPRTALAAKAPGARSAAAFVNVPVVEDGVLAAVLYVNDVRPREWTTEELLLIKEVAARIRTAGERLRAVAALRESEAKFRTIADAMPQMVWSTRPDGYHDYYNEQWYRYTGVQHGSTDGDGWNNIFHPEDHERAWLAWRTCLATGDRYEIQYRLRHHSGAYRWVLGRALPIRDEQGRIMRWMGTCTDIDDQKHAEEELRATSGRKDEFLAMLAHELRNPLAPISSAAQMLLSGHADPQRVQKAGEVIMRQVRHLTVLVDDLLDVARVTRGLVQLNRVELDMKEVLYSAVEQARPLIDARQHQLTLEVPSQPVRVAGDKTRLVQVVVNLLNNAAKYTLVGGSITLSLTVDECEVCIAVSDNGSGIAAALLPYIFDLFIQAERTPDREQGGLGLGLALVKRITALHDGSVQAFSDGVGKGSRFVVRLPLLESSGAADACTGMPSSAQGCGADVLSRPGRTRAARLMIVDDNLDGMQSLAALLEVEGYQVLMAESGAEALRLAEGVAIDAFVLDIGLPDIDGHELARQLRARSGSRDALLIALTGYGQAQDRLLSSAAGFEYHLVKPVDFRELTQLLAGRDG